MEAAGKVCILSMQNVDNMGSLLQAYALKQTVQTLGWDVEFLDIQPNDADNLLLGGKQLGYAQEQEQRGLAGKIKKIDRYTANRIQIKLKTILGKKYYLAFRKQYLGIEKKSEHYDCCIIGSDEVFNCMNTGSWGFTSQLFGNVAQAETVITYAASCGATKYQDLPVQAAQRIRWAFQKVQGFSVRDRNTLEFVSQLTDSPVLQHLDPVLIYDFSREMAQCPIPAVPKNYCLVYSYYNRIHTPREIQAIQDFCRRHRLVPVTVGAPQFWVRRHIECTPFQCLKLFQAADFVITDTFHGTIFSAKYADKFAVLTRPSNYNKLSDLIERLGIAEHHIPSLENLEIVFSKKKDQKAILHRTVQAREDAVHYLDGALAKCAAQKELSK